ncbi:sulfurtransferase-like selenium metabolism protein YedF [Anaerocolumna sp.]|uniref:sulfurtransferase-like selenium metabolism protein YedF n=1 Tax=Anaerocolumna sp. TaxID=2041569 RepID=UPI0028AC92C2|nr:sulfurtransferase-like selenium metabolism protein YedF [Anaerocolumna sp.]
MNKLVDAIGQACPIPVIMTKKEIDNGEEKIITKVDNKVAVENLKKLAATTGFEVEVKEEGGLYTVALSKECKECNAMLEELEQQKPAPKADYVVFIGKDYIGEGDQELGTNLMRMFLYTLTESADLPSYLLFMNGGVKLTALDEQAVDHIKKLKEKGVEVLVCGTCLNFYKIAEELKVGQVSNMYEILDKMQQAGKVISF